METVLLCGDAMQTRQQGHRHIAMALNAPPYYGENFDALADILSERTGPWALAIARPRQADPGFLAGLLAVLTDYCNRNPAFSFTLAPAAPGVRFLTKGEEAPSLTFVVVAARAPGGWVYCRKRGAPGWEIPGGHIEPGETARDAARRELWEETGAEALALAPIATYAVDTGGTETYGRLFLARVDSLPPAPPAAFEMGQVQAFVQMPGALSYPYIQPLLRQKAQRCYDGREPGNLKGEYFMAKLYAGDKMPNFRFNTGFRQNLTIDEIVKDKGKTIFWVLRYIGCTTCRYDVHQIAARYDEFLAKDTQVYVVMQSDPVRVQEDLKETPIPFEIICDKDQAIYDALEIHAAESREARQPTDPADIEKLAKKMAAVKASGFVHGQYEGNEQQLPAFFVTDAAGKVLYAHYAANNIDMPTVDEALALLDTL